MSHLGGGRKVATAEWTVKLQVRRGSRIKDFLNANLINILAAFLFLLLALFLLYPIIAVLLKSLQGPSDSRWDITRPFSARTITSVLVQHASAWRDQYRGLRRGRILSGLYDDAGPWLLRKPFKVIALIPLIAPPYLFALSLIILFGRNGLVTRALDLGWQLYGFTGVVISSRWPSSRSPT